jgi:hypothetical protein
MVVMVMNPMFVMAIPVPPMMPAVVVCQGYAGPNKDHESCYCIYFQYVAFHCVLLFPLNLPWLDGTGDGRVYIGIEDRKEAARTGKVDTNLCRTHF